MRLTRISVALTFILTPLCLAQQWEVGAASGFGWTDSASIGNLGQSASAGLHPGAVLGGLLGDNMYNYIGGEVRYLFQWGAPRLQFQGTRADMSGYSNLLVYDLLIHIKDRDSRIRPFFAAGAGIKIYTGTGQLDLTQPLVRFALLAPGTQVEPAISVGFGLKYKVERHVMLRADFRTYMTPLPGDLFRTNIGSDIRGWVFDFVPQVGVSYIF
jgi:hypothetical protein